MGVYRQSRLKMHCVFCILETRYPRALCTITGAIFFKCMSHNSSALGDSTGEENALLRRITDWL